MSARSEAPDGHPHRLAALDAVIFDMDGVVTETATVHAASWKRLFDGYLRERSQRTAERLGSFDVRSDYLPYVDGRNRYDGVRGFLASRGISLPDGEPGDPSDRETVCGLGNRKDDYFLAQVREQGVGVFESTVALVADLRRTGVRTGIVTASRNAEEVLAAAGVRHLFDDKVDGVVSAELGLAGKPDPATFLEAAARLGVEPARAAVVEDALSGGGGPAGPVRPRRRRRPRRPGRGPPGVGGRRGGPGPGGAAGSRVAAIG